MKMCYCTVFSRHQLSRSRYMHNMPYIKGLCINYTDRDTGRLSLRGCVEVPDRLFQLLIIEMTLIYCTVLYMHTKFKEP